MPPLARSAVLESLHNLLRPVARLCIRHSIKLDELVEALKHVMVEAAEREFKTQGAKTSDSRLSLSTGVHRKDVARIRNQISPPRESKNFVARVIGQWLHDERYTTTAGKPRVLPIEGSSPNFVELVSEISLDLHPYTVLAELERTGVVEKTKSGLKLLSDIHLAKDNVNEAFSYLGKDLDDLLCSVEENVFAEKGPEHLHLRTEYDNVSPEFVPAIRKWLLEEGSRLHEKARAYISKYDRDLAPYLESRGGRARVAFSTFSRIVTSKSEEE